MKIMLFEDRFGVFSPQGVSVISSVSLKPSPSTECKELFCRYLKNDLTTKLGDSGDNFALSLEALNSDLLGCKVILRLRDTSGVLKVLKNQVLIDANVRVEVAVQLTTLAKNPLMPFNLHCLETEPVTPSIWIVAKDMMVREGREYVCEDLEAVSSQPVSSILRREKEFFGQISISITTHRDTLPRQINKSNQKIYQKILEEEIPSDCVIISKEGKRVKCHKRFLAEHSPVLKAMFESDMKEGNTGILKMDDMTEDGVVAFLEFICYGGIDIMPDSSPHIAFELLNAGQKYQVPTLVYEMSTILMGKPNQWFEDVGLAVQLFLFDRNVEFGSGLKKKAIEVMKENLATLHLCPEYQELLVEDPGVCAELYNCVAGPRVPTPQRPAFSYHSQENLAVGGWYPAHLLRPEHFLVCGNPWGMAHSQGVQQQQQRMIFPGYYPVQPHSQYRQFQQPNNNEPRY